jgi:multidrug efflux system outer membrane protein
MSLVGISIFCITLLMILVGCAAVGPDYHAPEAQTQAGFTHAAQPGLSNDAVEVAWWRGFQDPLLTRFIETALSANHDLRIATANVREARALRLEAVFERYPIITSGASYNNVQRSEASTPAGARTDRDFELYNVGFDAAWELDFFGRVRRSIEARTAEVAAVDANRRDVIVSLTAEVARNYFELRGTQHQLEVARKNAANQQETLNLTLVRLAGGRGTELDTARARAQLNSTLATIPPLETTIERAIHRLSVLRGQPPAASRSELARPAPLPQAPRLVAIGKPEELLRRRSDIRVAERSLAAATAQIGILTADLFPRVVFLGNVALEASTLAGLGSAGSDTYSFGPSISWPAFDLGRVRARIQAADARAESQLARYEQTVLVALEETENALLVPRAPSPP